MNIIFGIIIILCLFMIILGLLFVLKLDKRKKYWIDFDKKEKEKIEQNNKARIQKAKEDYKEIMIDLETDIKEKKRVANEIASEIDKRIDMARDEIERASDVYLTHKHEQIDAALKEQLAYAEKELRKRYREVSVQEFTNYTDQKRQIEFTINNAKIELASVQEELKDFLTRREAINQAIMREREIAEQTDFYRVVLTDKDIADLDLIKDIRFRFYNREMLDKVAYESYIKKPLSEMIKRVLGGKKPSGIYKITYLPTGESYIGRSTDVSKRWVEHCKSAFNIGSIAHSTLHTKMAEQGIQNFTFELLEEVPKENLNVREKYYINLYGTKEYGMNMQEGG